MENIIIEMNKNKKINKGLPIVAIVFDLKYNIKHIESNLPLLKNTDIKWNKIHENHAEWLCMDYLDSIDNDGQNFNIIITSSPCDKCAKRIKKTFYFEKIYYLFEKLDTEESPNKHIYYKKLKNIIKYQGTTKKEKPLIKIMKTKWNEANDQNRQKTIKRQNQNN